MTAKTKTPAADVRLEVSFERQRNEGWGGPRFAHFHARAVVVGHDRHENRTRALSPDSFDADPNAPELRGLEVCAQIDSDSWEPYGWEVHYDDGNGFDLNRCEAIVKVLRRIDKRMDAEIREHGRPTDLAAFAIRAARALALPGQRHPFILRVKPEDDIEGTGFRSMDPDAFRWWLDGELTRWRAEHSVKRGDG